MKAQRTETGSSVTAVASSVLCAMMAIGLWQWQRAISQEKRVELPKESWEQVKDAYPLPHTAQEPDPRSTQAVEAVVQANPFSPLRRRVLPPEDTGDLSGSTASTTQPKKPVFVYKGRIVVGTRQRAIVADAVNQKTHFLEVGQEVTGFKVLDITENQVVLSNLSTREEMIVSLTATERKH